MQTEAIRAPRHPRANAALTNIAPQKLNLHLTSNFHVAHEDDASLRCGPLGSSRTIQYEVDVRSQPSQVDDRGFIVDWRDISRAVAERWHSVSHFPSCESFAQEICDLVYGLVDGRCNSIHVKVTIDGLPAYMTAEWARPEEGIAS